MADRMASSDVAKRRRLNDLETSLTTPMRGRLHENIDYIVENLTERPVGDKGNDVVTYRIRMLRDRSLDPRETVIVKACPRDDSKRRREGRPEVGFSTVSCEAIPVSQTVVDEKAFTLVRDPHTGRVQDIYFSIEDCNLEWNGKPLWWLSPSSGQLLADRLPQGKYVPLKSCHPDPDMPAGVPLHQQPQRDPRWLLYRLGRGTKTVDIFSGRLSGTKLWKLFGGKGTAGNPFKKDDFVYHGGVYMRYGRIKEPQIVFACALHSADSVTFYECGSYEHSTIREFSSAPDAIIRDTSRTYESLPKWYRKELESDIPGDPDFYRRTVDWTLGTFEAKCKMFQSNNGVGANFEPEYICQKYAQMMCTGAYWGVLAKLCDQTKDLRLYRIYRKPSFVRTIETTMTGMTRDLLGGMPYDISVKERASETILETCKAHAKFYNSKDAQNYTVVPWPEQEAYSLGTHLRQFDMVACVPDDPTEPTIAQSAAGVTREALLRDRGKTSKGAAAAAAKKREPEPPMEDLPFDGGDPEVAETLALWNEIYSTFRVVNRAVKAQEWGQIVGQRVFQIQLAKMMDLQTRIASLHAHMSVSGTKRSRLDEERQDDGGELAIVMGGPSSKRSVLMLKEQQRIAEEEE